LVLLAVDLLSQVASGTGVVAGRQEIGIVLQEDLGCAAQAKLLGEQQSIEQLVADLLGQDFTHVLGGAGIVEHSGHVGLFVQKVPQGPVVDAGGLAGDGDDAQAMLVTEIPSPGNEALKAGRLVGASFKGAEDLTAGIKGKSRKGLIRHVHAGEHRQPVQIGFEQFVGVYPHYGWEEAGLQFVAEGLTEGLQFAIHVAPP
jgi:hypothetical protein